MENVRYAEACEGALRVHPSAERRAEARRARAARERAAFDAGLKRASYEAVLSHCEVYWREEVLSRFRAVLDREGARDLLEIGSHGWNMIFENESLGARRLHCVNISEAELAVGREKAAAMNMPVAFHNMDAHELGFEDESFDVVFGFGILHHLDLAAALEEIARVLRPGGVMIFNEPLDFNPVGRAVRALTPAARTPDETPLRGAHVALLGERFDAAFHPQQFLSVPAGVVSRAFLPRPDNALMRAAFAADKALARAPGLKWTFRKVVIEGRKKAPAPAG